MKKLLVFLALAASAAAQNIIMTDGKVIATKGLRRDGNTIVATIEMPGAPVGQPPKTGEIGYPLAQIAKLDFPEPPPLSSAPDLIAQGKGVEALAQLEPVVRFYAGLRDAPGSWWPAMALLKMQALNSVDRAKEADALASEIVRTTKDPETVRAAQVQLASGMMRAGEQAKALEICEAALKESQDPATRAPAAVIKGQCLLATKQWEDALLAFLQVPVFYPGQKALLPPAMLGAGRAHFAMDDFTEAKATLNELIATYAASGEAAQAKTELQKIARREKALAPPE